MAGAVLFCYPQFALGRANRTHKSGYRDMSLHITPSLMLAILGPCEMQDMHGHTGLIVGRVVMQAGVMTLAVGNGRGTYVLNKQGPNLQIWSSSPVSGPVRYDWSDGHWRYARDGSELMSSLSKELTDLCGVPLTLTQPQDD